MGYSRAVRIGHTIEVSGTCSVDEEGMAMHTGDPYNETKRILDIIQSAIEALGGEIKDVVRTRIYTTDISMWEQIGKAHGEVFGDIRPATSMIEISRLINPSFTVEIEATAIISA